MNYPSFCPLSANALLEMTEKGFGMTTVTDTDGKLLGVLPTVTYGEL